jgi:hypothetical protein
MVMAMRTVARRRLGSITEVPLRSARRKAQMQAEWNHSQGLLRTSSGRSQRRNGRKFPSGPVAGSTRRSTRCRPGKTGRCGGRQLQEARLKVLPADDGSLPHHRTKSRPTPQCWWCASETQTRDHVLKECAEWRGQQRTLWVEARRRLVGEESLEGLGSAGGRETQQGGIGLPRHHGWGEAGAGRG